MTGIVVYGIKSCDTMKKAMTWLNDHGVAYEFHDYKKQGADADVLKAAIAEHGWDKVINRAGTTWRKLPEDVRASMGPNEAVAVALDNPSIIKRPLLSMNGKTFLGFKPDQYKILF